MIRKEELNIHNDYIADADELNFESKPKKFSIDEIEKQEMRVGQMSELCNKLSLENTRLRIENERLNKKLSSIAKCFISTSIKDDIEMAAGKEIKEILEK